MGEFKRDRRKSWDPEARAHDQAPFMEHRPGLGNPVETIFFMFGIFDQNVDMSTFWSKLPNGRNGVSKPWSLLHDRHLTMRVGLWAPIIFANDAWKLPKFALVGRRDVGYIAEFYHSFHARCNDYINATSRPCQRMCSVCSVYVHARALNFCSMFAHHSHDTWKYRGILSLDIQDSDAEHLSLFDQLGCWAPLALTSWPGTNGFGPWKRNDQFICGSIWPTN